MARNIDKIADKLMPRSLGKSRIPEAERSAPPGLPGSLKRCRPGSSQAEDAAQAGQPTRIGCFIPRCR